jgi:hypothetical protein
LLAKGHPHIHKYKQNTYQTKVSKQKIIMESSTTTTTATAPKHDEASEEHVYKEKEQETGTSNAGPQQPTSTKNPLKIAKQTYEESIRALKEVKNAAYEKYMEAWNALSDYGQKAQGTIDKSYNLAKKSYEDAKQSLLSTRMLTLEVSERKFYAARRELREAMETAKRWLEDNGQCIKKNPKMMHELMEKDKLVNDAMVKYDKQKDRLTKLFQDIYDDAVQDFFFAGKRMERAQQRWKEYDQHEEHKEEDSTRRLEETREDARRHYVWAKVRAEELRERMERFLGDVRKMSREMLEYLHDRTVIADRTIKEVDEDEQLKKEAQEAKDKIIMMTDEAEKFSKEFDYKVEEFGENTVESDKQRFFVESTSSDRASEKRAEK